MSLELDGRWRGIGRSRGFDMTQADFARRIGVSQSYSTAVVQGRNEVGTEVLPAITPFYDVVGT